MSGILVWFVKVKLSQCTLCKWIHCEHWKLTINQPFLGSLKQVYQLGTQYLEFALLVFIFRAFCSPRGLQTPWHTVAIWTFPFHQNSVKKKWWFSRFDLGSVKPQKIIFLTNEYEKKSVVWWKESIITLPLKCLLSTVHTMAGCEWLKSVVKFKSIFWLKLSPL